LKTILDYLKKQVGRKLQQMYH